MKVPPTRHAALRQRVTATEAMIQQIDDKIVRLGTARRDRVSALTKIRSELARPAKAGQAAPDYDDRNG